MHVIETDYISDVTLSPECFSEQSIRKRFVGLCDVTIEKCFIMKDTLSQS